MLGTCDSTIACKSTADNIGHLGDVHVIHKPLGSIALGVPSLSCSSLWQYIGRAYK